MPITTPAASGPKLLGNEQARRPPATTGDGYYVGDRYSTAAAPVPTTAATPSVVPAVTAQTKSVPRSNAAPVPATVPSTAGARYPASRY